MKFYRILQFFHNFEIQFKQTRKRMQFYRKDMSFYVTVILQYFSGNPAGRNFMGFFTVKYRKTFTRKACHLSKKMFYYIVGNFFNY